MPGQTDCRVQITHYLSHRDYTIVQRECYHRHAKRRLPCVTAACEQDPRKCLKNTVCSQGLSIHVLLDSNQKVTPYHWYIWMYSQCQSHVSGCVFLSSGLKKGQITQEPLCRLHWNVKAIKRMQNIITMCDSLNTEPVWPGLDHHPAVLA